MPEKIFCIICDRDAGIVKVIAHGVYDEQILSCQHFAIRLNLSQEERERETSLH
jgi:hypothetical protein